MLHSTIEPFVTHSFFHSSSRHLKEGNSATFSACVCIVVAPTQWVSVPWKMHSVLLSDSHTRCIAGKVLELCGHQYRIDREYSFPAQLHSPLIYFIFVDTIKANVGLRLYDPIRMIYWVEIEKFLPVVWSRCSFQWDDWNCRFCQG